MKTTDEIKNEMEKISKFEDLIPYMEKEGIEKIRFCDRLYEICEVHNVKQSVLQKRVEATIAKSHFYAIFNGERNPSRKNIIHLGLAADITLEEMNELLKLAKYKELYPKIKEDAVVIFGLNNHESYEEIFMMLEELKEK